MNPFCHKNKIPAAVTLKKQQRFPKKLIFFITRRYKICESREEFGVSEESVFSLQLISFFTAKSANLYCKATQRIISSFSRFTQDFS
jgi:hypothetical protein